MKVLVDTSVWSLALRRGNSSDDASILKLKELILAGSSVYLSGLILTEILSGIKHSEQFQKIRSKLDGFILLDLDRSGYEEAATLANHCRKKGVQVSTVDVLIAQIAISHNCSLLTVDKDFEQIAKVSDLQLL